jgi:cytochrome c peroxidase
MMRIFGFHFQHLIVSAFLGVQVFAARLEVVIEPVFRGEPLRLDSLSYQNTSGEVFSVTRLSYLLSGFALECEDGRWLEVPDHTAWLDAGMRRNVLRLENLPEAKYRSLRFHVGPDAMANAADPSKFPAGHPLNPSLNGLHWSWQGGYIFMAVEGLFRGEASDFQGYAYHLARDENRTRISLSGEFDLMQDAAVVLHFDLATLFHAPRPLSFKVDGASTHSREGDPIAKALVANLAGSFRVNRSVSVRNAPRGADAVDAIDMPEKFTPYRFAMSRTFPVPALPRDNPLIEERIALGKRLFHETALSRDGSISCASCHQAEAAFTDRLPLSVGIDGRKSARNAMPLFNLAWKSEFFWDGRASSLREQVLMPIEDHREMDESLESVCAKLESLDEYRQLFGAAYRSKGVSGEKIAMALEQFLLTLGARDAKFDRALRGELALSEMESRGFELFMTEYEPRTGQFGADCFHCHGGALFTDHQFHNNGLSGGDVGRAGVTGMAGDHGKFVTPSLRNVEMTAPYMHDGRFATLEEVLDHYSGGVQRSATLDPNLAKHPAPGIPLGLADKAALVAFLKTLGGESIVKP